jgi:hypothetical protein
MRTTAGGIDVDEQPGFVVEGARVALGPLRMDLVATYQRWENDLEVANANGRVLPFTLEATRERIAGRPCSARAPPSKQVGGSWSWAGSSSGAGRPRTAAPDRSWRVVAEELGPSLRWATATATRTTRSSDR